MRQLLLAGLLLGLATLVACDTTPTATPAPANAAPIALPSKLDEDLAAVRFQDISGALLLYYSQHGDVPPELNDLLGVDHTLKLTSPYGQRNLVYLPTGLSVVGQDRILMLYDPLPSPASNTHWAIVITPKQPRQPLRTEVVRLAPSVLKVYCDQVQPQ